MKAASLQDREVKTSATMRIRDTVKEMEQVLGKKKHFSNRNSSEQSSAEYV